MYKRQQERSHTFHEKAIYPFYPFYSPTGSLFPVSYTHLAQFRKLESLYEEESAAEQAQDEAFYLAAKVQLYDFFAATVDVFGDMPFSRWIR